MARSRKEAKVKYQAPPLEPEHPWERLPGETDPSWHNFIVYRDAPAGERSLSRTSAKTGVSIQTLEKHSQRWGWVGRVRAYDAWKDREAKKAEIEEVREMRRRHIQMAMSLQGVAALALNKIAEAEKAKLPNGLPGPLTLKPSEVKELAELGMRIERLNRGEPEAIEEHRLELNAAERRQELRSLLEGDRENVAVKHLTDAILNGSPKDK